MANAPNIDPKALTPKLVSFIQEQAKGAGKSHLVIGLSGGLDSAVSAYLGVRALGAENLTACLLPYQTTDPRSTEDARLVIEELGTGGQTVEITPIVEAYFNRFGEVDRIRKGNFMARARMAVLYDLSMALDGLVMGTGNRTEALLGYTTLWGDMACAFTPIGGLFKTEVRQLAAYLGIPQRIIDKPPSADLWVGQTDEGELGLTYEEVDRLLHHLFDLEDDDERLAAEGFEPVYIAKVRSMVEAAAYKRRMPSSPSF